MFCKRLNITSGTKSSFPLFKDKSIQHFVTKHEIKVNGLGVVQVGLACVSHLYVSSDIEESGQLCTG